jgi:hypothetical protein
MKHFLHRVAAIYFEKHAHEINHFTFVFPNRRAGLFFQQYLAKVANRPFFSPAILTIEQWFENSSDYTNTDKLYLLFRLYELFINESNSNEGFDNFAYWGDIILNDFNEVDKYLVDADQLFSNIADLKNIDEKFDYFSENQLEAIRSFWKNFNPLPDKQSQLEFVETWKVLHALYSSFRNSLIQENLSYEGMLMRDVVNRLQNNRIPAWIENKKFVFIGFNALNPCEKAIMTILNKWGNADFYWDYDAETVQDPENPASKFFIENTTAFPSRYPIEREFRPLTEKVIHQINVPSGVGQAKEAYAILNKLYPEGSEEESFLQTAIVLPDEQLLMPLLYSIPTHIKKINVTMGYPMNLTPVSGLMDHIFEMHRRKQQKGNSFVFYHQTITNILNHQFISEAENLVSKNLIKQITFENKIYIEEEFLHQTELFKAVFKSGITVSDFLPYLKTILFLLYRSLKSINEGSVTTLEAGFLYQYYSAVTRVEHLIEQHTAIEILNLETLIRIVRELTATITIPFVGEPLDGLQLMGVLETRGLDFKNVIICSFNEGIYPKKSFSTSFIPYQLRKGFELPTYEQLDAVTAYNFYRLLHHADNIYFLTDTRSEGGSTGEVSRFFYQLKYYYQIEMHSFSPKVNVSFETPQPLSVNKDARLLRLLDEYKTDYNGTRSLSASGINTYIKCPLAFYLSILEDVEKQDEISETVENDTFGNIFHFVMSELYAPFSGRILTSDVLQGVLTNVQAIERLLSQAFAYYFFKKTKGTTVELEGNNLLIAKVILKYIKGVIERDIEHAPFTYVGGEKQVHAALPTQFGTIRLKGFIDRIDQKDNQIRILDYKTGNGTLELKNWDSLFDRDLKPVERPKHILQTFLYCYLLKSEYNQNIITPGLFFTRKVFDEHFSTELRYRNDQNVKNTIENYYDYENEFIPRISACIEDIFNPQVPFEQTKVKEACTYCDYKTICKR